MNLVQALLGFGVLAALITVTPGLDVALVLRSTLSQGRRSGAFAALGICSGLLVWGSAAALGGALLLATSQLAYTVVSLLGAAYLVVLGFTMIVRTFRTQDDGGGFDDRVATPRAWRAFLTGLTTNVLNPKVGVFYVATIPQFIPSGYPPLGMGLALALVHVCLSIVWLTIVILASTVARRWLGSPKALRAIDRTTGGVLIAFGAGLALERA